MSGNWSGRTGDVRPWFQPSTRGAASGPEPGAATSVAATAAGRAKMLAGPAAANGSPVMLIVPPVR